MGKTRGFTLIELLVVVAIIAVLTAILLPSLNRAHDQGYREMGVYNCPKYPDKEQTLDYVINSWKNGASECIGSSPIRDFRQPSLKILLADNGNGSWHAIV